MWQTRHRRGDEGVDEISSPRQLPPSVTCESIINRKHKLILELQIPVGRRRTMAAANSALMLFQIPSHQRLQKYNHSFSSTTRNNNYNSSNGQHHQKKTTTTTTEMVSSRLLKPISSSSSGSPGLYSADQFELTPENVDLVLEDVRPYLIADGGNVDVVSVDNGVVSLRLQGACGSCPSSTTTMKMGIERVLKEKFGDAVKEICQVYGVQINETTVEAVNGHLDILRPAVKNYGGSVEVLSVEEGDCVVKYVGPESIGSGIKAAIKDKFPDIVNVVLAD